MYREARKIIASIYCHRDNNIKIILLPHVDMLLFTVRNKIFSYQRYRLIIKYGLFLMILPKGKQ